MLATTTLSTFSALAPSAKTAFLIGFASWFASQQPGVGLNIGDLLVVNPATVPLNQDIIAFSQGNLKNAMDAANYSAADILQEQEALKVGLAVGKGTLVWDPETSVWNYQPSNINFIPENFSPNEQLFINYLINGGLNKISEVKELYKNMNLYEQIHALFLAFGSLIFVQQCIKLAGDITNCLFSFVGKSCLFIERGLKILISNKTEPVDLNDRQKIIEIQQKLNKMKQKTGKNNFIITYPLIKWAYKGSSQKEKEKNMSDDKHIELWKHFEKGNRTNETNPIVKRTGVVYSLGGGGRTKRRSYKSKRRRSSKINSKRRRHKTKKRAYRSTRFASHK